MFFYIIIGIKKKWFKLFLNKKYILFRRTLKSNSDFNTAKMQRRTYGKIICVCTLVFTLMMLLLPLATIIPAGPSATSSPFRVSSPNYTYMCVGCNLPHRISVCKCVQVHTETSINLIKILFGDAFPHKIFPLGEGPFKA